MPYDETVNQRILSIVDGWSNTEVKKMFGGVGYLVNGHMVAGVYKDQLILRLGVAIAEQVLKEPHVRPFDITGRPMKGWVMVAPEGFEQPDQLDRWLTSARAFVLMLPAK